MGVSTPDDPVTTFYDRTAEYVAVLLGGAWDGLGPALSAALDGLAPAGHPVVDVGAGTGLGTRVIAAAVPDAEILAVEPHPGLRTALLAGIAADPSLRTRVTVLDADLLTAELPERVAAVVLMNVIGHFTPPDRWRVWALLAERLAPGGRAVVNLHPPHEPVPVPRAAMGEVRLGRRVYSGAAGAEPAGDDAVTWTMNYRVTDGDATVAGLEASDHWFVLTPGQLAAELAPHGLTVTPGDPGQGIQVITAAAPTRRAGSG